jgi:uncharacterized protein YceH (UPF0502 family)
MITIEGIDREIASLKDGIVDLRELERQEAHSYESLCNLFSGRISDLEKLKQRITKGDSMSDNSTNGLPERVAELERQVERLKERSQNHAGRIRRLEGFHTDYDPVEESGGKAYEKVSTE